MPGKRGNGEGSVYFQESRQRWAAAVTLVGGKRNVIYGKTRQEVARKLTAAPDSTTGWREHQHDLLVAQSPRRY